MEEKELVQKAKQGDQGALGLLLQQQYAFLTKYLLKVTLQPELAKDLVQETMMRCIKNIRSYNGESKFSSWLITIANHLYIDYLRKEKRNNNLVNHERLLSLRKIKWQVEQQKEDWSVVLEVLNKISDEIRIAVVLKYYYGYSLEEIAKMLDIPVGTVKSRLHNGLQQLRKELKTDEGEN